jgi:hypothetical protein
MKENPLTMEVLDQLTGLNIIQIAAIPLILLVILEWILTIVQKKDITTADTISYRTIVCRYLRFIKNRIFESYFFYNIVP